MAAGRLTISLDAVIANWRALDRISSPAVETGAVVKADAYGLGMGPVASALAEAGARKFFVAQAEEGARLREMIGGPFDHIEIYVLSGHMDGDSGLIRDAGLIPLINSVQQMRRHFATLPAQPFGLQLDTGMNRLGIEPEDVSAVKGMEIVQPRLIMSHLACADEPDHPANQRQLAVFQELRQLFRCPASLSATAGIMLGRGYDFDLTRPGVGLYGGMPFDAAQPVIHLSLPIIQTRWIEPGEMVGYGASFRAERRMHVATLASGYADGILRSLSNTDLALFHEETPCPLLGRVSMDVIAADITHLHHEVEALDLINQAQTITQLAAAAKTIDNEILTCLGGRYERRYKGG